METLKARLLVKLHTQKEGIDDKETFSSIAIINLSRFYSPLL